MTFTIDSDNNITAHAAAITPADGAQTFTSAKDLVKLTATWPTTRLAEIWNGFAGVTPFDDLKPVKKFTDRKAAVNRLWKAVQRLAPDAGAQPPTAPPKAKGSRKAASRPKGRATAASGTTKSELVISLLRTSSGASLEAIMKATGWQAHSVRGFISGVLSKKLGLTIESLRNEQGGRIYRISK
jgi:hypothetical protein